MTATEERLEPVPAAGTSGPDGSNGMAPILFTVRRFVPYAIAVAAPFVIANITIDSGFRWQAIVGIVVLAVVARLGWTSTPAPGKRTHRQDMWLWRTPGQRSWAAMIVFLALAAPFALAADVDPPFGFPWSTWFTILNVTLVFAMGAAAFNLLVGYTGQISLAQVAFLVLGTIVGAQVGIIWNGNFWYALPAAAAAGAVVGTIVGFPALRLRGLYLLLATLGVHFVMLLVWREYLQANFGFVGIRFPDPTVPTWLHWLPFIDPDENGQFLINSNFRWYWVILPLTAAALFFMTNVVRTREGRAFAAVRERDVSASLLGVNVARSKLLAFAISSAIVAMSGTLGSYFLGARGEDSFNITLVLDFAVIIVVGGFMSIQGAVFGSFFWWVLPELFSWAREEVPGVRSVEFFNDHPSEIDLVIKGALVVLVLVFKPQGLTGVWNDMKSAWAKWVLRR